MRSSAPARLTCALALPLALSLLSACGFLEVEIERPPTPTATPEPVRAFRAQPRESYVRVSWSPDGKLLATSGNDPSVNVWDTETLQLVHQFSHLDMEFARFTSFSPDGRWLMVSEGRRGRSLPDGGVPVYFEVAIWNLSTGERLGRVTDAATVWDVVWSPRGEILAYWDSFPQPVIRFWAPPGGGAEVPGPVAVRGIEIGDAVWLPDGGIVAVGSGEGGLGVWRSTTPEEVVTIENAPVDYAPWVTLSPDGALVAAPPSRGVVSIWDVATGRIVQELRVHELARLADAGLAFSPDRSLLATGVERDVLIWDVATGGIVARLSGHESAVNQLAFSPDGKTLAVGEADGIVRLWWLDAFLTSPVIPTPAPTNTPPAGLLLTPELVSTLVVPTPRATPSHGDAGPITPSVIDLGWPDNSTIRLTSEYCVDEECRREITAFEVGSSTLLSSVELAFEGVPFGSFYSSDGSRLAFWLRGELEDYEDDAVAAYSAETGGQLFRIPAGETGSGNDMDWSPDGSRLAVHTFTSIELFDGRTGAPIGALENSIEHEEGEGYMTVDWSPDGARIASYLTGYQIGAKVVVWDAQSGRAVWELAESPDSATFYNFGHVEHIAWSPDGSRLLLVRAGRAEILDVETGQIRIMAQPLKPVTMQQTGAWSSDGAYVALDAQVLEGGPLIVLRWNTRTNEVAVVLERGPDDPFVWRGNLLWAPGRHLLATIGSQGTVYVVDAQRGARLEMHPAYEGETALLAWSPDGERLAAVGYTGAVSVWSLPGD